MAKIAILLFAVGLGLGLWFGFDPHMHQRVVQNWNMARQAYIRIQTEVTASFHSTTVSFNNWLARLNSGTTLSVNTGSKSGSSLWKQITSGFGSFWNALQRIWLNIKADFHFN